MSVAIKTKEEIQILKEGGKRLAEILASVAKAVKPGVSTLDLDRLSESLILKSGGKPAFKGYRSKEGLLYNFSSCISVNDELVHGMPREDKLLKEGDILGLDLGMIWPVFDKATAGKPAGLYTDMAVTIGIGKITKEAERLLRSTKAALEIGLKAVKPGVKLGDVSYAIQRRLEKDHLGIIRDLAGHGVGYGVHEEPLIPNFGKPGTGLEIKEGMVLAIEPMATLGDWKIKLAPDGWTFKTADGSLSAHFEHTIAVTKLGAEIMTVA